MEIDRMCRILKIQKPPEKVKVVKSLWLSACIKQKDYVDTNPYELNTSKYIDNIEKKDLKEKAKKESVEPSTSKGLPASSQPPQENVPGSSDYDKDTDSEGEGKSAEPKKLVPAVGHMFRFSKRAEAATNVDDDADSDYVPSDGEDGPSLGTEEAGTSSEDGSPKKKWLPVGILENQYYF